MELFSVPWWSALLAIILIDLVLAGDNAIVIALAARNLPPEHQNKAIVWGTVVVLVYCGWPTNSSLIPLKESMKAWALPPFGAP
jgi:hypothetical protein